MHVFRSNPANGLSFGDLKAIKSYLLKGGIGILPTDSVYTIACLLSNKTGIARICQIADKKMQQSQLSIICSDFEMVSRFALPIPNPIFRAMKASLPGPYTFIINADVKAMKHYENRRKTIGIRIPDFEFLTTLVSELNEPLICSSLHSDDQFMEYENQETAISRNYEKTMDFFLEKEQMGLIPSTVYNCTSGVLELIREGKGELL